MAGKALHDTTIILYFLSQKKDIILILSFHYFLLSTKHTSEIL